MALSPATPIPSHNPDVLRPGCLPHRPPGCPGNYIDRMSSRIMWVAYRRNQETIYRLGPGGTADAMPCTRACPYAYACLPLRALFPELLKTA